MNSEHTRPWTESPRAVLAQQSVDPAVGLTGEEVEKRAVQFGPNQLAEPPREPLWRRLAAQFRELVILILIAAAVISGLLGEWVDAAAILAIVLLNGAIGFFQEARAERALAALRRLSHPRAKVLRDGNPTTVDAKELVPGDLLTLEAGDQIPADARVLTAFGLAAQEAALTGESSPSHKAAAITLAEETPLADRENMIYMGTVIAAGKATAVVTATGMRSELGSIASLLLADDKERTPLQVRLEELGRILIMACLGIVAFLFAIQWLRGDPFVEVFLLSVSLAVAVVPEGMPAVVTIALALGLQRMVRRRALIRRLPSVETLGSVTVICSDKTGTLTCNEMTVREIVTPAGVWTVSGIGYEPVGELSSWDDDRVPPSSPSATLARLLLCGVRCNNAKLVQEEEPARWAILGDPTEGALLVVARKAGLETELPAPVLEFPFDSESKRMSVVWQQAREGKPPIETLEVKGAPEVILDLCRFEQTDAGQRPVDEQRRAEILQIGAEMAGRALRVLALACRDWNAQPGVPPERHHVEKDLVFLGLMGLLDPPRDEVKRAVQQCHLAGIRPVMITGDHPATALAIGRELGIATDEQLAVTGTDIDDMSDDALRERLRQIAVYARVSAAHKMRVVRAWQDLGEVVAMTGDGVNDGPAVQAADIGIAMGITGTDVTKEASDMILMDDNFASIVSAVEEGRGIFDNIQKFIHFLLSCNAGEVMLMLVAAIAGWPMPLLAIHLLWINLVTDGFPALALGMETPEKGIMQRPPRPPRQGVITRAGGFRMLAHGSLVAAVAAAGFWLVYRGDVGRLGTARTAAFCIAAFAQLLYAFSCRSFTRNAVQLGLFTNRYLVAAVAISACLQALVVLTPGLRDVFHADATVLQYVGLILALSLTPVTLIEISKWLLAVNLSLPRDELAGGG